ncbi:MAG TPA: HAD-IC family P-type ATPase [Candidatus Paceibacterota bacterium]|nr:HAD-IC family P-type ATPase [Candidatus Paceibacterota bacterium]
MSVSAQSRERQFQAVAAIISRNVFLLVNGIIFAVVFLLAFFGDVQEGLFLGGITVINIVMGCFQEINSWYTLEKLQLLAIPHVVRLNADGTDSVVLAEDIKKGDTLKLTAGDQVPCDGALVSSHGFEVSEALITGESVDFLRKPGDAIAAGSIVTAGTGVLRAENAFVDSRIAQMAKSIKTYSLIQSPIQYSLNTVLKYIGYVLLFIILFVGGRGYLVHESTVAIIQNIGALTNILLPQGMVVMVTLLFSYGAAHLYGRHVLLQQVNATEKLGRVKNLCMDKTGTLTSSKLVVEHEYTAPGISERQVAESIAAYMQITVDASKTIQVIRDRHPSGYTGTIVSDLTFSSTRQFGAVHMRDEFGERVVLAGAPDVFLPHMKTVEEKAWAQTLIDTEAKIGKRLLCFVQSGEAVIPQDLAGTVLIPLSIIVINNELREGVIEAVQFFQARGVTIRIISGDNAETVQAVATAAGVEHPHVTITGAELADWTDADYREKAHAYTVFARIKPEQKEKIITALKEDGFTAMIGDGANDALAIKKADLGIAMFDGAQATRQIAGVVLVKNSFTDLPGGVRLADSIIQNIEICAAVFFNEVFLGFFFFILLAVFGYSFPFTPLNITFLTYFSVTLPCALILYWVIRPVHDQVAKPESSFLRQVIPFALVSAIPQALVTSVAFYTTLERTQAHAPTSLVLLSFIIVGIIFFIFTPSVYSGPSTRAQKWQFLLLIIIEIVSFSVLVRIPIVTLFYNLSAPSVHSIVGLVPLLAAYAIVQYALARRFSRAELIPSL